MHNYDNVEFEKRFNQMVDYCMKSGRINLNLYTEYDVKRGLRDSNGNGVLTGLTEISDVLGYKFVDGKKMPDEGSLYYQGYRVRDLVGGFRDRKFGFEETTYLLLFGELPNERQLQEFLDILGNWRELPDTFVRDIIMKVPSSDMMNVLQKSVLTLYSYDENPNDISIKHVLNQSLHLIAQFPLISVYGYQAYRHYHLDKSLVIRHPKPELSTAENILRLLRPDGQYTELEAKVLDVALVLHADHGGGNNSTFTTHVVSGGANLKVQHMFADIKAHVADWEDEEALRDYLRKIVRGETFDGAGLIYGLGHAVYTKSDPRCLILKEYAKKLSAEKGCQEEFALARR